MATTDLLRAASEFRDSGLLGKSPALVALFDYLVAASSDGRAVKEVEVAAAVFGPVDASGRDASVRVYVHRLRGKLADYYAGSGEASALRLTIPRGEYRLLLLPAPAGDDEPPTPSSSSPPAASRRAVLAAGLGGLAVGAGATGVALALSARPAASDVVLDTVRADPFWAPVVAQGRPIVVVLGDYYLFGERGRDGRVERLVREFAINSRYDLDERVMANPDLAERYVDVGLRYYPIGIATAVRDVLPVLATPERRERPIRVLPASDLTPDMLRTSSVVYLGYLSALGALRNPVFNGSRFAVGATYDELVDRQTGRTYRASTGDPDGSGAPARDYAYLANFPGPNGMRVVIVAGTRDAAVMQAADFAVHAATIRQLTRPANGAVEALVAVDSLRGQNMGGRLVTSSPMRIADLWRDRAPQDFPDDARVRVPAAVLDEL